MTYTYKLARRLAILRHLGMFPILVLFGACMGETTGPESASSPLPVIPIAFRVVPGAVTIETNQPIRFRGESRTERGTLYTLPLSWESSGGSIRPDGTFSARQPGAYKVVGRGRGRHRPDTSIVVVVPPQEAVTAVEVSPRTATVRMGDTHAFTAVGRLGVGDTAPIGVIWSATGGTIDPSGLYTAGPAAGEYRVVATNTGGSLADTALVTVTVADLPVPEPPDSDSTTTPVPPTADPAPPQPPTLAAVILKPAALTLATGGSRQLLAYGRNSAGDSVAVPVIFRATGGTITPGGLYTAGQAAGSYRVIATSNGLSDTALITLTTTLQSGGGGGGIPFGPSGAWDGTTLKANTETFNLTMGSVSANAIVERINVARTKRVKLLLAMTGGNHDNYLTNGVFDRTKWLAKLNTFDTPAIRQAIADGVADGTILGNSVMDEPHVYGLGDGNTWGPKGTMTKVRVDSLCSFVKAKFPTLPVGVAHGHDAFEPTKSYRVCEFMISQYAYRKGDVRAFRDAGLALAQRDDMAIVFSMNIMNGGIQAPRDGLWNCPSTTGGRGTYEPNCRMTPQQIVEWGTVLGSAGCGLAMWRYDESFMALPENQRAFKELGAALATLPTKSCRSR